MEKLKLKSLSHLSHNQLSMRHSQGSQRPVSCVRSFFLMEQAPAPREEDTALTPQPSHAPSSQPALDTRAATVLDVPCIGGRTREDGLGREASSGVPSARIPKRKK